MILLDYKREVEKLFTPSQEQSYELDIIPLLKTLNVKFISHLLIKYLTFTFLFNMRLNSPHSCPNRYKVKFMAHKWDKSPPHTSLFPLLKQ
jgi:nitrate reductase gamma subunit